MHSMAYTMGGGVIMGAFKDTTCTSTVADLGMQNALEAAKEGLEISCDDCGAEAGVECSWNCSSNWGDV